MFSHITPPPSPFSSSSFSSSSSSSSPPPPTNNKNSNSFVEHEDASSHLQPAEKHSHIDKHPAHPFNIELYKQQRKADELLRNINHLHYNSINRNKQHDVHPTQNYSAVIDGRLRRLAKGHSTLIRKDSGSNADRFGLELPTIEYPAFGSSISSDLWDFPRLFGDDHYEFTSTEPGYMRTFGTHAFEDEFPQIFGEYAQSGPTIDVPLRFDNIPPKRKSSSEDLLTNMQNSAPRTLENLSVRAESRLQRVEHEIIESVKRFNQLYADDNKQQQRKWLEANMDISM